MRQEAINKHEEQAARAMEDRAGGRKTRLKQK